MNREYAYAKEKLYLAALCLAGGRGEVKERLLDAALAMHTLRQHNDLPGNLREEFQSIWTELTRVHDQPEEDGYLKATIDRMTPDEAHDLAERIFHLYGKVLHGSSL